MRCIMTEFKVGGIVLREVPGFENYGINEDGTKIWSKPRLESYRNDSTRMRNGNWIEAGIDGGYRNTQLCKDGKKYRFRVHILVALTWIGPPPFEGAWVLHKDDDKKNNHFSNLYYGTPKHNSQDMVRNGRAGKNVRSYDNPTKGSSIGTSKLTEEKVREIKKKLASGYTRKELAEEYEMTSVAIGYIDIQKTWKHVQLTEAELEECKKNFSQHKKGVGGSRGSNHPEAQLTEDDVSDIKRKLLNGVRRKNLATEYNVSYNVIQDIDLGYTWKHVQLQ